jgi:phage uncharacterized protein (putative large terminase), C-terminal domain
MTLAVRDVVNSQKIATEVRGRSQESFKAFIRLAWDVIEPGVDLLWNWHIDAIADHLEAVYRGEINKLVCNIAPGHMKSTIFSVMYPAWMWIKDPTTRWLCASHSLDLAIRDNRNCRNLIESEWFQSCFGDIFQLSSDQNVKNFFENTSRGHRMALSVGTRGTGKRGTHLLIDDPNNATATNSEIESTVNWFGNTWMSRLNSYDSGAMIIAGQRIHERDLTGHVLSLGGWEHLVLPTEYEPGHHYATCIGFEDKRKEAGELLWPEKFPAKVLDMLKKSLGPVAYAAQYQQSPTPASGAVFSRDKERLFTMSHDTFFLHTPKGIKAINKNECSYFMTVDPAISEKQAADYTVIQKWAKTPYSDILLMDLVRGHWGHNEQQEEIQDIFNDDENIEFCAVETIAYQHALFQDLVLKGIPCKPFKPNRDKVSRAGVAAIWQSNGKMYFSKYANWLAGFQGELYKFPKAHKDDQVDATSLAAIVVRSRGPLSDDDGNYDEIPDPIEGPIEPEAINANQREIPFTQPFINIEENEIPVEYVKPTIKPINPFEFAARIYGDNW